MWHPAFHYSALQGKPKRQDHREQASMVWLQVDAASSCRLREVVIRTGGDAVRFLRIDGCAQRGAVRALLCVQAAAAPALRQALLHHLPGCAWQAAARRGERLHAC